MIGSVAAFLLTGLLATIQFRGMLRLHHELDAGHTRLARKVCGRYSFRLSLTATWLVVTISWEPLRQMPGAQTHLICIGTVCGAGISALTVALQRLRQGI